LNQLQEYPSVMKSNNSVTLTSERKRVWIPSGNPIGSKHSKKFVGYSVRRMFYAWSNYTKLINNSSLSSSSF